MTRIPAQRRNQDQMFSFFLSFRQANSMSERKSGVSISCSLTSERPKPPDPSGIQGHSQTSQVAILDCINHIKNTSSAQGLLAES